MQNVVWIGCVACRNLPDGLRQYAIMVPWERVSYSEEEQRIQKASKPGCYL